MNAEIKEELANTQLQFEKIQSLSPERMAEVDDFVDFLKLKEQESLLTQSAAELSTPSFVAI